MDVSCPDPGDGFPTILALSILQVDLSNHIPCPLNDHLLTFWAEGVFSCVAWDIANIDIFKACRGSGLSGFLKC